MYIRCLGNLISNQTELALMDVRICICGTVLEYVVLGEKYKDLKRCYSVDHFERALYVRVWSTKLEVVTWWGLLELVLARRCAYPGIPRHVRRCGERISGGPHILQVDLLADFEEPRLKWSRIYLRPKSHLATMTQ